MKTDWRTMIVLRFDGFAFGFSEGMTGEKLGVRMSLRILWKGGVLLGPGKLPCLKEMIYI